MVTDVKRNLSGMELRGPAHLAPYRVVEIREEGRGQPTYNVVNGKGLGVASFGCSVNDAVWFCDAANERARRILHDRGA